MLLLFPTFFKIRRFIESNFSSFLKMIHLNYILRIQKYKKHKLRVSVKTDELPEKGSIPFVLSQTDPSPRLCHYTEY
jgi:hypothetical protein